MLGKLPGHSDHQIPFCDLSLSSFSLHAISTSSHTMYVTRRWPLHKITLSKLFMCCCYNLCGECSCFRIIINLFMDLLEEAVSRRGLSPLAFIGRFPSLLSNYGAQNDYTHACFCLGIILPTTQDLSAPNFCDFCDLRCPPQTPEIASDVRDKTKQCCIAIEGCDGNLLAISDFKLRFRSPKPFPSVGFLSIWLRQRGKPLAIAIVRFWCAKHRTFVTQCFLTGVILCNWAP